MDTLVKILLAGGIMLAIALVFGVILVLCANVFAVKKDERIAKVENLLAKSNCGGCGRAGCAQFAEALVKGEAKLSDCKATPAANKEKIAELLGGGEIGEETVAVVHCNGGNACFNKYEYQGYGNCASCELIAGGVKACPVGCIGKRTCADICPHYAIEVGDGGNETGRMVPEGGNVPPPHAEADDSDTQLLHYHALPRPSNSRGGTFTQRGSPRTGPGAAQRAALPRIRRTSAL